jgi:hypothetical protein
MKVHAIAQEVSFAMAQHAAYALRFHCPEYTTHSGAGKKHPDGDLTNISGTERVSRAERCHS